MSLLREKDTNMSETTTKSSARARTLGTKSSARMKAVNGNTIGDDVPRPLRERVLGALWLLARGTHAATDLATLRGQLADVSPSEVERAVVAMALEGTLE